MEDLIKDIKSTIAERFSSPLLGSFLISWCIWNYKFIVILLSDASVTTTFKLISNIAFPSATKVVLLGLIAPLSTALLYVFAYPIPAKFVYEYTQRRQREILEIRQRIEGETPLTLEQSRQIRDNLSKQREEHFQVIERKDAEIERLKREIADLQQQQYTIDSMMLDAEKEAQLSVDDQQHATLEFIGSKGGFIPNSYSKALSADDRLKFDFNIGELTRLGLLESRVEDGKRGLGLSHKGRRALIQGKSSTA